jgi:superfamily II DNA or RNA helicase
LRELTTADTSEFPWQTLIDPKDRLASEVITYTLPIEELKKKYKTKGTGRPLKRFFSTVITRDKREQAIMDFKNNKYNVMLASKVLDEGVNLPKLDMAIIMAGDSTEKQTVQRVGRVLRKKKDKLSTLIQIYCRNTFEERNSNERAKLFKSLSTDYKHITYNPGNTIKID